MEKICFSSHSEGKNVLQTVIGSIEKYNQVQWDQLLRDKGISKY